MGRLTRHQISRAAPQIGNDAAIGVGRTYRYDAAGNLSAQIDLLRGRQDYRYDPVGRILAATGRRDEFFAFDPAGNIQPVDREQREPSPRIVGGVGGNRLRVFQDLRYSYDVHGNVASRDKGAHEQTRLRWNADHQLSESTVTRHGVTQTTRYEYDALGRRTRKIDAFGATEYLWDGDLMLHSQRGNKAALFVFEPGNFVPLATIQDNATYWYQCDQIGTPQELTDQQGEVVWAADYKVWGEVTLRKTGTGNHAFADQASAPPPPPLEQPFRFQGQQFDEETGLHYNRFRYYDPGVGRFVSQDPIGLNGGINTFQYAVNSTGWMDPLGLAGRPPNLSPCGAGRRGAFREAKRQSNIPVCTCPTRVTPNEDKRGKKQKGLNYEFDKQNPDGTITTQKIQDDAGGHDFGPCDDQNRGPHFNDDKDGHYDY